MSASKPKLHLGCGTVYLPGYVNIDFPPDQQDSQHAVESLVDEYADITNLNYDQGSVSEVRLHHVFEHFDRPTALRLLFEWYDWLCEGGSLTIETPDFYRCVRAFVFGDQKAKGKALRHLFGSHDAHWAVHYDGWYKGKFILYLTKLGFQKLKFSYSEWCGTYNITVKAMKLQPYLSIEQRRSNARELLSLSLVDDSDTEQSVLDAWMESFTNKS